MEQDQFSLGFESLVVALEDKLRGLDVLIAEVMDPERMESIRSVSHLEIAEVLLHRLLQSVQLHQDPTVNQVALREVDVALLEGDAFKVKGHELVRLPDLVAEIAIADNAFEVQVDRARLGQVAQEGESEGIGTAFGDASGELHFLFLERAGLLAFF